MTTVSGYYQLECEIRQLKGKLEKIKHQTHLSLDYSGDPFYDKIIEILE